MAQQIKKKFIAPDAIDGSKLKLMNGEALRLQTPGGEVELLKKDAQGKLVSEGDEISFKQDMEAHVESVRSSLQSNIDAEESARIADVDAEQSRAEAVEASLQSQLTQEVSDRIAGDASLQAQIDNVLSNLDPAALDSLTEIVSAFQAADSSLQGAISTLAGNSSGNIEAEQSRAEAAEASLQSQISQEISDREADVDAEQSRAEGVEASLQSQISQEISDRSAEDLLMLKKDGSRAMTGNLDMGGGPIVPSTKIFPFISVTSGVATTSNVSFSIENGFDGNVETIQVFRQTSGSYPTGTTQLMASFVGGVWTFVDESLMSIPSIPSSNGSFTYTPLFTGSVNYVYTEQVPQGLKIINLASGINTKDAVNVGQLNSTNAQVSTLRMAAGVGFSGYTPDNTRFYSQSATSLHNADKLLDTALKNEESARIADVNAEESRAMGIEGSLQAQITQEISDRMAEVSAEESRAMDIEGSLQAQITQEISDRISAVSSEQSRAEGVESSLQSQISQEISDREADVDAEESRAMGVESSLQSQISQEISDRISAVSSEQSRAEAAEQSLQSQINNVLSNIDPVALDSLTEIVAAFQDADSDINDAITTLAQNSSNAIAAEQSRAEGVEASLQSQISQEVSDREAAISAEASSRSAEDLTFVKLNGSRNMTGGLTIANPSHVGTLQLSEEDDTIKMTYVDSAGIYGGGTFNTEMYSGQVDVKHSSFGKTSIFTGSITVENSNGTPKMPVGNSQVTPKKYVDDEINVEESRAMAAESSLQSAISSEASSRSAEDLTFFKLDGSREVTGSIIPSTDVSYDLGSSSKRFRDLFLSGNTIDLGGVTLSNESNEFVVRDGSNELAIVSDNVKEGMVNKFFTEERVQESELSLLDVTKSGAVVSSDSLIDGISKLQNQMTQEISDRQDDVDAEQSRAEAAEGLLDGRLDVLEALAFEKESFTLGVNPTGVTLAHSPKAKSTVMFVGRLALHEGLDYSISGNVVTFIGDFAHDSEDEIAAAEGDVVKVTYYY